MIHLTHPPIGIKVLPESLDGFDHIPVFRGVSYCRAVFEASFGAEWILQPESIRVCQWAPIVLGFKESENWFERSIRDHLPPVITGLYLAPLHCFRKDLTPDVVIIRTSRHNMEQALDALGENRFISGNEFELDRSAVTALGKRSNRVAKWFIEKLNALLYKLSGYQSWHRFTTFIFKSTFITYLYDRLVTRHLANMSMCRNSTVLPLLQQKANISYFCTGGIAWGKNDPQNMTAGYPYALFKLIAPRLDYPGMREGDPRLDALREDRERLLARGEITAGSCQLPPGD
ncbi:MAG: DUF169 domain-containing protein [Proteobacteria bacterium]|nr:DUF169 domain-containing protein [Pseudomonadota bacterium]